MVKVGFSQEFRARRTIVLSEIQTDVKSVQFIYVSALKYIGGTECFSCLAHLTTENLGGKKDSKHPQEYLRKLLLKKTVSSLIIKKVEMQFLRSYLKNLT